MIWSDRRIDAAPADPVMDTSRREPRRRCTGRKSCTRGTQRHRASLGSAVEAGSLHPEQGILLQGRFEPGQGASVAPGAPIAKSSALDAPVVCSRRKHCPRCKRPSQLRRVVPAAAYLPVVPDRGGLPDGPPPATTVDARTTRGGYSPATRPLGPGPRSSSEGDRPRPVLVMKRSVPIRAGWADSTPARAGRRVSAR